MTDSITRTTIAKPTGSDDNTSSWQRFIEALRTTIGLKPIYLAERWVEAKVHAAEDEARLLAAQAEYAKAVAEAERLEAQHKTIAAKDELVRRLLENESTADAMQQLLITLRKIEQHGGSVEVILGDRESNTDESE
jgi:hypothetical protein